MELKYAKSNINSMNVLLSNLVLKMQVVLKEELTLYLNIANETSIMEGELNFTDSDVYNPFEIAELLNKGDSDFMKKFDFISYWFINKDLKNINQMTITMKKQLYAFSLMTQSLISVINSNNDIIKNIYIIIEGTEIMLASPFIYFNNYGFLEAFANYTGNPSWCTDEKGNIINYYNFRCRPYYRDILGAQKDTFDLNYNDINNRRLFITAPYHQFGDNSTESVFTVCIKFNDIISNQTGYICGDSEDHNLFTSFDMFNDKLIGYAAVTSVGFNEAFYFPQILSGQYTKTLGEFIYRSDNDYFLEEKRDFLNVIQKYMTSNYIKKINGKKIVDDPMSIFDEVFIFGGNVSSQKFYINNKEYYYALFPIIINNFDNKYEHVLSIIYIFNINSFFYHMIENQTDSDGRSIFQVILYFFFGSVVLYIISLSFKLLAKFIVIPIKNIHYMLEGINVGGEYRLEYLSDLKKKQEDNLDKLNKINQQLMKNNSKQNQNLNLNELITNNKEPNENKKGNELSKGDGKFNFKNKKEFKRTHSRSTHTSYKKDNLLSNSREKLNKEENKEESTFNEKSQLNNKSRSNTKLQIVDEKLNSSMNDLNSNEDNTINNIGDEEEYIDSNINYEKKYDRDVAIIEKELNFYDFDEELLQYRPVELDNLVQSLLNLKSALILTSRNQEVENIIGYTNSEFTFSNFKNKEGSRLCQSNIGNLQSRLAKYDKAIYHLALSLQNVDLKKFFSSSLTDELDESDSLLHKIEITYRRNLKDRDVNKLVKKQRLGKRINFSQKIIEILINSRYNKLINIYFKFFSIIQKINCNYEKLGGYFMHSNFHTINYYHKIIIQYIYLCFISNDLVKIGESILDYIEFLIKFKLKISDENSYILNIHNQEIPEIKEKQKIKKKYFDKIISWINLFDSYAKQINENSSLGNYKNVIDAYTHNLQSNHNQFDSGNESASVLLFQINLQRYDFLRGKFALECKEYNDALGFMINAAKKKRIVIDGLIKKRALKHIAKIAAKLRSAVISNNYSKLDFQNMFEKEKLKTRRIKDNNPINNIGIEQNEPEIEIKSIRLIDKVRDIIDKINNDINETNEKQLKNLIVLIDCNLSNKLVIESYIDVTKTILKNYMINKDRIGVFFLLKEYRIICPIRNKEEIDFNGFSNDLDISVDKLFNKKERLEYSSLENEEIQEKIKSNGIDFIEESKYNSFSDSMVNDNQSKYVIKIEDTIKSINYCLSYLKMKEISKGENFFIYFSSNIAELMNHLSDLGSNDYLNNLSYESSQKKNIYLQKEPKINFLLVGKYKPENEEDYKSILIDYFGEKSDVIPFDNMKKIKSIFSSNNIINDNIIFPNEIYK